MKKILSIILIILGAFMAVLDTTIVDIIIPKIQGPLSTDLYGAQWIITAYMMSAAVMLLMSDYLIKNFGTKKIFLISISIFSFASFMCGLANDISHMIFWRVIQGIGVSSIMVSAQLMVFSMFKNKGLAMGVFSLGVAFAPAIGPTLGGYLTQNLSWRSVFFINIPIGIIILIFGSLLFKENEKTTKSKLNFISLILIAISTVSLLIVLSQGNKWGWLNDERIVYLLFVSIIGYLLFAINEIKTKNSLFDYRVFKNYYVVLGFLIYFILLGFSMYQLFYLLPIYYEKLKGLNSIDTGFAIFGFGIFIGISGIIAGILSDKISPIIVLVIAAIIYIFTITFLLPTLNYYTPYHIAIIKTIPFGIALGMFFAPITTLIMQKAKELKNQAVMIMDYIRFIGGSFGTAIATNELLFNKEREFEAINIYQNREITEQFINSLQFKMQYFENIFALNYAFYSVWMVAAFWGIIGSSFVFMLLFKKR